jgi:hypothetical protein
MFKNKLYFIIIFFFISFYAFSEPKFSINYELNDDVLIIITTILIDKEIKDLNIKNIEISIYNQLLKNKYFEICIKKMPDYINDIIELIDNKEKRNIAIKIFEKNNIIKYETSSSENLSINNGKISYLKRIENKAYFKIFKEKIIINPIEIILENKKYTINGININ